LIGQRMTHLDTSMRFVAGALGLAACVSAYTPTARARESSCECASDSLTFRTDEITAMHLDVSPDGKMIVFDVLGGIYSAASDGGPTHRLAESAGWDQEPKYSPDGRRIAFVSDRDGLATIWIANADGTQIRRLVADTMATYAQISWVSRDWLLAQRTLTSGSGRAEQLVEISANNGDIDEIRTNEAVASAVEASDRSVVYYGTNDGHLFAADRSSARMLPTSMEESSCGLIPSLSRDDRLLAYGCAANGAVAIYVADIVKHTTRLIAPHSAPFFGWNSASTRSLPRGAFSADGRYYYASIDGVLRRIRIEDGESERVPLIVDIRRRLESPADPSFHAPIDSIEARAVSWPSISADGTQVAFVVAGKVYVMDAGTHISRRATSLPDSVIEFGPAISPNGLDMTIATWDAGGTGKIVATTIKSAQTSVVASMRGRIGAPTWSADGTQIAFAHEVRRESAIAGVATLASISIAQFASPHRTRSVSDIPVDSSSRWYFPKIAFIDHDSSVFVASRDRTRWQLSELSLVHRVGRGLGGVIGAEDVSISPSGHFLATVDRSTVRIQRFDHRGTESPLAQTDSVVAAYHPGGAFIRWIGDSAVTWSSGNTIYRRSIGDSGPIATIEPAVALSRSRLRGTIAILGGRAITMRGNEVIPDATVIITDGRIAAIGARGTIPIPHGAQTFDVRGRTVVPGLIDTHAHIYSQAPDAPSANGDRYRAYLSYGVTTTFDPQASSLSAFSNGEQLATGHYIGPRAFTSGDPLYGGHGYDIANPAETVLGDDEQKMTNAIADLARSGTPMMKVYEQPRRDRRQKLARGAAANGLRVTIEGACELALDLTVAADAYQGLEHAPAAELHADAIQWFARSGIAYTPTLGVACGTGGATAFFIKRRAQHALAGVLPTETRKSLLLYRRAFLLTGDDTSFVIMARGAVRIMRAGGSIALGSHGTIPGLGMAWEIQALAMGGATAMEALRAATLGGAVKLGLSDELGSIAPGKIADLTILRGNPLANLAEIEHVEFVVHDGVLRKAASLSRVRANH
jgi:imidazolonepropionase-like amidohydrolase/Tol biopolymer transport system component